MEFEQYIKHVFDKYIKDFACCALPNLGSSDRFKLKKAEFRITHHVLETWPQGQYPHIIEHAIKSIINTLKDNKAKYYIHDSFKMTNHMASGLYAISVYFIGISENLSAGGVFYEEEECLVC